MKAAWPISLLFFALLAPLMQAEDAPLTMGDLDAANKISSGEIGSGLPAIYTAQQVNDFLQQFVGVWKGQYTFSLVAGRVLQTMDAQVVYSWEKVGDTMVLKGQSVYVHEGAVSYARSQTYFWLGRLVSEIEQDGQVRIYLGRIADDGATVSWGLANAEDPLKTATKESFSVLEGGRRAVGVSGYEEIQRNGRPYYVQLTAELIEVFE